MAERSPVCGIPAGFLRKSNASTPTLALAPAPAPVAALPLALEMDATAIRPISVVAGSDSDEEELLLKGSRSRPCTSFSPPAQIAASNVAGPVPSPHLAASGPSALVVGTLVNVYLHKHKGWFAGRVVEVWRLIDGTKHRVLFDDGDLLWINFSYGYERFEVLGKVVETSSLLEVADGSGRGAGSKRARASLESSVAEAHWSLRGALHGASGFPLTDADGGAGGSSGSGAAAAPADASDAAAHGAVASAERRERRPKRLNFSRPCPRCGEENHVRRLECEVCGLVLKEPVSKRRAAAAAEAAAAEAHAALAAVGRERLFSEDEDEDEDEGEQRRERERQEHETERQRALREQRERMQREREQRDAVAAAADSAAIAVGAPSAEPPVAVVPLWLGGCCKTQGCMRADKHGGRCKVVECEVKEVEYEVERILEEQTVSRWPIAAPTHPIAAPTHPIAALGPVHSMEVDHMGNDDDDDDDNDDDDDDDDAVALGEEVADVAVAEALVAAMTRSAEVVGCTTMKMFLVKWKGWPIEDATWEPAAALADCPLVLDTWMRLLAEDAAKAAAEKVAAEKKALKKAAERAGKAKASTTPKDTTCKEGSATEDAADLGAEIAAAAVSDGLAAADELARRTREATAKAREAAAAELAYNRAKELNAHGQRLDIVAAKKACAAKAEIKAAREREVADVKAARAREAANTKAAKAREAAELKAAKARELTEAKAAARAAKEEARAAAKMAADEAKKAKPAIDPNRPKQPLTSYMLWQAELRKANAPMLGNAHDDALTTLKGRELAVELGQRWRALDAAAKVQWEVQAKALREAWLVEVAAYDARKPMEVDLTAAAAPDTTAMELAAAATPNVEEGAGGAKAAEAAPGSSAGDGESAADEVLLVSMHEEDEEDEAATGEKAGGMDCDVAMERAEAAETQPMGDTVETRRAAEAAAAAAAEVAAVQDERQPGAVVWLTRDEALSATWGRTAWHQRPQRPQRRPRRPRQRPSRPRWRRWGPMGT